MIANRCSSALLFAFAVVFPQLSACADDGQPVAIRHWPGEMVTIETHWGLVLALNPNEASVKALGSTPDKTIRLTDKVNHLLDRLPNEEKTTWTTVGESKPSSNALQVRSLGSGSLLIEVDGVRILATTIVNAEGAAQHAGETNLGILFTDTTTTPQQLDSLSEKLGCHILLISEEQAIASHLEDDVSIVPHNTFGLAKSPDASAARRVTVLSNKAWTMPQEMADLFRKMEASCATSQAVFSKLSVDQMNFKPSNGTHTPRWNTEHMMGRQLGFFSQIYHAIDPTIPAMNLNPKQMPADYQYAHPDWDGKEEARQMQRVSDFTRRFAYLLDGLDLDERAPGSRWPTLRALIEQMVRHYGEHTANTVKKFDLPDWPAE